MKVAIGTVCYNSAVKFFNDFIESINNQHFIEFDVIIVNDGVDLNVTEKYFSELKVNYQIIDIKYSNIVINRITLIRHAIEQGYDILVFCDIDDTFDSQRIEKTVNQFDKLYAFFYNDIKLLSNKTNLFRFLPNVTKSINAISHYNYIGLSNSALNLKLIPDHILEEIGNFDGDVFDWCMYSLMLLNGLYGKKIIGTSTFYRIHDNNIAGNSASVIQEMDVKLKHYSFLSSYDQSFTKLYEYYKSIYQNLKDDPIKYVKKNEEGYWWNTIK